jgi:hypothetical protein
MSGNGPERLICDAGRDRHVPTTTCPWRCLTDRSSPVVGLFRALTFVLARSHSFSLILLILTLSLSIVRGATPVTDQELVQVSKGTQNLTSLQVTQLGQQLNYAQQQLAAQQQQLAQFGKPQQYVNLLQLDQFNATASSLQQGVGQTAPDYAQSANGTTALAYTGQGLYADLSNLQDNQGNPVTLNQANFKKYAVLESMSDNYTTQLKQYNSQMASLQQQLVTAMNLLNQASTQMETLKYQAQVNGLNALINALASKMNALGQSVILQAIANENDAARVNDAAQQKQIQDRRAGMARFSQSLSTMLGGQATK